MPDIVDIRPPLRAFILGDPTVGGLIDKRMYPMRLPQNTKEASIVYSRVSAQGDHHMEGPSGLARSRFQIDAWAQKIDDATALADAVKARIDGYRGQMTSTDPAITVDVQGVFFESEREDYDAEAKLYRVSRDYLIAYGER